MPEPYIVCDNLVRIHKVAGLEVVALQGLDLVIEQGELVAIVGASGSGKSTLMSVLGGLDRPSAGRVWVAGKDLLKLSDEEMNEYRRQHVGFVWQQGARNLIPYLTAVENVELMMILDGQVGRKKLAYARELLDLVGLGNRHKHRLAEMSGGEQQRVAIAVALANSPSLILADEPTGEVDSATAEVIYETFRTLNREMGITTLIVSHDPGIARHVGRVVMISDGRLATETVRRSRNGDASPEAAESHHHEEEYHERVVLDASGRLQIPKTYLERFNIKGRAQVDMVDDGILIRPILESEERGDDAERLITEMIQARQHKGLRGLVNRWLLSREKRQAHD